MGKYQTYLNSQHWKSTRNQVRRRVEIAGTDFRQCERCKEFFRREVIEVHHKHYQTIGRERQNDLEVLCKWCHAEHHGKDAGRSVNEVLFHNSDKQWYLDRMSVDRGRFSDGLLNYRRDVLLTELECIERADREAAKRTKRPRCRAIGREAKVRDGIGDG